MTPTVRPSIFAGWDVAGVTPAPGADEAVALGQPLAECQGRRDGEFGHGGEVGLRGEANRNAAAGGVVDINAVHCRRRVSG